MSVSLEVVTEKYLANKCYRLERVRSTDQQSGSGCAGISESTLTRLTGLL